MSQYRAYKKEVLDSVLRSSQAAVDVCWRVCVYIYVYIPIYMYIIYIYIYICVCVCVCVSACARWHGARDYVTGIAATVGSLETVSVVALPPAISTTVAPSTFKYDETLIHL